MKKYISILILVLSVLLAVGCVNDIHQNTSDASTQNPTDESEDTTVPSEEPSMPPSEQEEPSELPQEELSLEEAVKQLLMVCCDYENQAREAARFGVGAVCLFKSVFNNKDRNEVIEFTSSLQEISSIPLLISVDEEGGRVVRVSSNTKLRSTPFQSPQSLKNAGGIDAVIEENKEKCKFLADLGINVNIGPVADVPSSKDDYIYSRAYSTDKNEVSAYVSSVVGVMGESNIGSVLKHFPGYGNNSDTHYGYSIDKRPLETFTNCDLLPFSAGIKAGADAIMVSHNIVECFDPDNPASLSRAVHDYLRNEMGFEGVIITDSLAMGGVTYFENNANTAIKAILAGNDLLCCEDYISAYNGIMKAIEDGLIKEEDIYLSAHRVIDWKMKIGIITEE